MRMNYINIIIPMFSLHQRGPLSLLVRARSCAIESALRISTRRSLLWNLLNDVIRRVRLVSEIDCFDLEKACDFRRMNFAISTNFRVCFLIADRKFDAR